MTRIVTIYVLLVLAVSYTIAENSYLFVSPKVIRPGVPLTIQGSLLKEVTSPVVITITLEKAKRLERPWPMFQPILQERVIEAVIAFPLDANGTLSENGTTTTTTTTTTTPAPTTTPPPPEPLSTAQISISDTNVHTITLQIPATLVEGDYQLGIKGSGGLVFTNTTTLQYERKTSFVVVQTDKAIYKPGQTVHFRVFGATPDLRVKLEDTNVELFDPNGNQINQWNVPKKDMAALAGVYEDEMLMSDAPVLGDWKFKVSIGNEKLEKIFTVDEYVLPKFEVNFDLPSFGRINDADFTGKVTAKYTYGKPVKGKVSLRIKPKWPSYNWINGTRVKVDKEIELKFPIDGTESFTVTMENIKGIKKYLDRSYLVFEANVTETLTGAMMSANDEVQFFENSIKLDFPDSLPRNFKPGMAYTAVLKVSEQDDSPANLPPGEVEVKVVFYRPEVRTTTTTTTTTPPPPTTQQISENGTVVFVQARISPIRIVEPGWWWPRDEELAQPPMNLSVPLDGLVEIPLTIPADITRVSIDARFQKSYAYLSVSKAQSPSDNFIQLKLLTDSPKAGTNAEIEVRSTEKNGTAMYQVMSKGFIVESGQLDLASGLLRFPVTSAMAPKAKVMVFCVRKDGEIVADGLSFNIDDIFDNRVSIEFNRSIAQPANKISLTVKADPGSKINILAVDRSVQLLKTGNDITKDQVRSELESFDSNGGNSGQCGWFCWRWPMPTGGVDTEDVFNNAGLAYLTDALIYDHRESWRRPVMNERDFFMEAPEIMMADAVPMAFNAITDDVAVTKQSELKPVQQVRKLFPETWLWKSATPGPMPMMRGGGFGGGMMMAAPAPMAFMAKSESVAQKSDLKPVQRVRKLFPETWLWKSAKSTNGTAVFEDTVPDTITSWIATAFAVHPESGLGLSDSAKLETFIPFFVSLHIPYSVVRGEKVIVQANVFNYNPQAIFVYVLLHSNTDYDNIHITSWWSSAYSADVARFIRVEPNSATPVYFPIIPRRIGKIDLHVQAQSLFASDAIKKQLIVEPEGSPQEYNFPVLIDLSQQPDFVTTLPISFPPSTVQGSERITVSVIGDLMGPSINGLDSLLKMPYGCGEQNMLNFAPNIFITKYLEITNNLDEAIFLKSKGFMIKGYQKELTYQHDDGSFSAFGNSDPSGSMWLSAFVLKSFVQAKPYIFIDDDVLYKTITWILKYQNVNGTFQEPGKVLHKEMQGGSTAGEGSLTSFVLAALLEARSIKGVNEKITEAVSRSVTFLEGEVANMTDVYELAITGYVLTLAGSTKATDVVNKLQGLATVKDGMKYWTKADVAASKASNPWESRKGNALNIELTSYALLTLAENNNREDGLMVLKWLTGQRNPNGGYSSTQDTIVALQSLAEMASKVYSKTFDMNINVEGNVDSMVSESFAVNPANALILQTRKLPTDIRDVTISASGRGLSLVEIAVFYNILQDELAPSFDIKVSLPRESINEFQVQVCTRWLKEGTSGMAVIEIGTPSGFIADKEGVKMGGMLKRVEEGNRKLILYIDEIGMGEQCYNVDMQRTELVAGAQPVPVKVYDYYEPTNQITTFYVPEAVRNSNVCDVCGKECEFCNNGQRRPLFR